MKADLLLDPMSDEAIEAAIATKGIGKKIRRLRLRRSLGLAELGQRVGLSPSFLSQLETGKTVPTIKHLARLALAFNIDLAGFLHDESEAPFRISRASERRKVLIERDRTPLLISESMGGLTPDRQIVPCIAEFRPGPEDAAFRPQLYPGMELVYVICGALTLSTKEKTELLEAADSAWIDGNSRRLYRCHDQKPAKVLIVPFSSNF